MYKILSRKKIIVPSMVILFLITAILTSINGADIDANYVSIETASKTAEAKIAELGKSDDFSITSLTEIFSDDGILLCYLAELQPHGYIVISSDMRLPPVGAYSLIHNCRCDVSPHNLPFQILREGMKQRLETISHIPAETVEKNHLAWNRYLDGVSENEVTSLFRQWPPEGTTSTGGWVETTWHQNSPYNDFCPLDEGTGERSVAGCPAVTMAQILNYHATTNNVTFDDSDDYYHNYDGNRYWIDNDHDEYLFPSFPELNGYLAVLQQHYQEHTPPSDDDKAKTMPLSMNG